MAWGQRAARAGDRLVAYHLFIETLALDPCNDEAWVWRAGTTLELAEARLCLQQALTLNPHNPWARRGLEDVLRRLDEAHPSGLAPVAPPTARGSGRPRACWPARRLLSAPAGLLIVAGSLSLALPSAQPTLPGIERGAAIATPPATPGRQATAERPLASLGPAVVAAPPALVAAPLGAGLDQDTLPHRRAASQPVGHANEGGRPAFEAETPLAPSPATSEPRPGRAASAAPETAPVESRPTGQSPGPAARQAETDPRLSALLLPTPASAAPTAATAEAAQHPPADSAGAGLVAGEARPADAERRIGRDPSPPAAARGPARPAAPRRTHPSASATPADADAGAAAVPTPDASPTRTVPPTGAAESAPTASPTPTAEPTHTPPPTRTPTSQPTATPEPAPPQEPTPEPTAAPDATRTPRSTRTPQPDRAAAREATRSARPEPTHQPTPEPTEAPATARSRLPTPAPLARAARKRDEGWVWPAHGPLTTTFGEVGPYSPRGHAGIDIAAPMGAPVVSVADGTVVTAARDGGYGIYAVVDHHDGTRTLYAHLSRLDVGQGDTVERGQLLGRIGSTGYSTGPHLHFEVRTDGGLRNPLAYLP